MTATVAPEAPPSQLSTSRSHLADRSFRLVCLGAGLLVFVILVLITVSTTKEAWPAFKQEGFGYLTSKDWSPNEGKFGALAFIYGTVVVSAIALVLAMPVSIGIALFLTEVAPRRVRQPVVYVLDLLAAVPSVVFGLWAIALLRQPLGNTVYRDIANWVSSIPILKTLFGPPVSGASFFTAGMVLALMITPIITSLSREVFMTVPNSLREAALAMGSTRWEMIRASVLPYGKVGLVGAVMLGLGRAMGETIAVALVIGSSPQITAHLFAPGDAMPAVIANQFGEASGTHRAALIGLGVVLFFLTILINVAARAIFGRAEKV
ncbi:MAG: phosphate transport system permease protein [Acidimicrobiia bacterium]|jgi:phosphate transport system permease protein|nr:phosphate transport system permease protein [Acidimicrobiia bacterium]